MTGVYTVAIQLRGMTGLAVTCNSLVYLKFVDESVQTEGIFV